MEKEITNLAEYGVAGVAIAIIIAVVYIIRLIVPVIDAMRNSIDTNTRITNELATYIKLKNGEMAEAVKCMSKEIHRLTAKKRIN